MDSSMDANSTTTRSDRRRERFLAKAEGYLLKYKSSHSTPAAIELPPPTNGGGVGGGGDGDGTRHLDFLKKAQGFLNKKDKKNKEDNGGDEVSHGDSNNDTGDHQNYKEHITLVHAMLNKIKKHKGKHGKGSSGNNNEEEQVEEEEEEIEEEEEEESGWFSELMEGIQEFLEELNEG
ncbi:hypothetical protein SOVF_106300 [Spinacia oleracea]|nr:hypothetical protein SOVF_106300 [Spinacia oleracea]